MPRTWLSLCCLTEAHTQKQTALSYAGLLAFSVPSHRESHLAEGHLHGPFLTLTGASSTCYYVRSLSQSICSSCCFSEVSSHFLPASCCTFPPRSLQPPPSALIDFTKETGGLVPYVLHANYSHRSYQNILG